MKENLITGQPEIVISAIIIMIAVGLLGWFIKFIISSSVKDLKTSVDNLTQVATDNSIALSGFAEKLDNTASELKSFKDEVTNFKADIEGRFRDIEVSSLASSENLGRDIKKYSDDMDKRFEFHCRNVERIIDMTINQVTSVAKESEKFKSDIETLQDEMRSINDMLEQIKQHISSNTQ